MTRANDFWISDRQQDIALGGMTLKVQAEMLEELLASRARERELEAALSDPAAGWHDRMLHAVAEKAAALLPPVEPQGAMMRSVWIGRIAKAIERAVYDAYGEVGLVGDHPGLRLQAKLLLTRSRADVRAALGA